MYRFLYLLILGIAYQLTLVAETTSKKKAPNILFAFADDWGRFASAYQKTEREGSLQEVIHTPTFDQVAKKGVLFKHAFVTAPSCTPCRSSLLSGQYFFRTGMGAILQGARWDASIPSFPLILRDAGYHIGQTYKVWTPGSPSDGPYGARAYEYESQGRRFNQFSQNVTRMMSRGLTVDEAKNVLFEEVLGNLESFLEARPDGAPFCYWFGPTLVHRKWVQGSGKKLWGIDPDRLKGRMPKFLPDVPVVREDLADYFGEIQAFDTALGLILRRLREMGELENTVIVVSGDHGAPGFPNGKCNLYDFGTAVPLAIHWPGQPGGRVVEDFVNLMDLAPTLIDMAGLRVPSIMTGRSLVPQLSSEKQGWIDPSRDWVITGRERHVAKARDGGLPYPQRALRTKDYLYIHNFEPARWPFGDPINLDGPKEPSLEELTQNTFATFGDCDASPTKAFLVSQRKSHEFGKLYEMAFLPRPREELFLLKSDPDQVKNLAYEPAYLAIKEKLRRQLMVELRRVGDPRVVENPPRYEKPPYAGLN